MDSLFYSDVYFVIFQGFIFSFFFVISLVVINADFKKSYVAGKLISDNGGEIIKSFFSIVFYLFSFYASVRNFRPSRRDSEDIIKSNNIITFFSSLPLFLIYFSFCFIILYFFGVISKPLGKLFIERSNFQLRSDDFWRPTISRLDIKLIESKYKANPKALVNAKTDFIIMQCFYEVYDSDKSGSINKKPISDPVDYRKIQQFFYRCLSKLIFLKDNRVEDRNTFIQKYYDGQQFAVTSSNISFCFYMLFQCCLLAILKNIFIFLANGHRIRVYFFSILTFVSFYYFFYSIGKSEKVSTLLVMPLYILLYGILIVIFYFTSIIIRRINVLEHSPAYVKDIFIDRYSVSNFFNFENKLLIDGTIEKGDYSEVCSKNIQYIIKKRQELMLTLVSFLEGISYPDKNLVSDMKMLIREYDVNKYNRIMNKLDIIYDELGPGLKNSYNRITEIYRNVISPKSYFYDYISFRKFKGTNKFYSTTIVFLIVFAFFSFAGYWIAATSWVFYCFEAFFSIFDGYNAHFIN
jgi:hypothetical protein